MTKTRWTSDDIDDQTGRVAIVTGANSGIGFETAKVLAARGAQVILACRSEKRGVEAVERIRAEHPEAAVELSLLDLSRLASVRAFAERTLAENDRIDLLINNAGVMVPPKRTVTEDGFELQMGTNHFGHFLLTGLLLDRITATEGSRIVNVASLAHKGGSMNFDDLHWDKRWYLRWPSYGQSKLANLLFTFELDRRLREAGSSTIAVAAHPGWTGTNLQRHVGSVQFLNGFLAMPGWQGALPTLRAAVGVGVKGNDYYGPDGFMEMRGYPKRVGTTAAARNGGDAARLWTVSEELVDQKVTVKNGARRAA